MVSVFHGNRRRVPIAWPCSGHVEEHWHRRRLQNLWKVWALEVLTGRPWLPSLEGPFSIDNHILLCRYIHGLHVKSRNDSENAQARLRTTRMVARVTRLCHKVFFQGGMPKRTVDFEKLKVAPSFWFLNINVPFFVLQKLSQEDVVQTSWQFTVKMLIK